MIAQAEKIYKQRTDTQAERCWCGGRGARPQITATDIITYAEYLSAMCLCTCLTQLARVTG